MEKGNIVEFEIVGRHLDLLKPKSKKREPYVSVYIFGQ